MKQKLLLLAFTLIGTMLFSQSVPMAFTDWWTNLGTQHMFQKNVTKTDGSNTFTGGATLNVNGKYDGFLTKINSSGTVIFTVQINGTANDHDFIAGMYLSGSDVYVTGTITNSVTMLPELFIAKYNSSGTQQFFTTYSNGYGDLGKDIVINASTGYIVVTGASYNSNFDSDISTIAFNSSGVQQWATFYNHANLNDGGFKITTKNAFVTVIAPITISTNNYKLASITYSASNGVQSGSVTTGATATSSVEIISDVVGDGSGNLYLCGATQQNAGQGYDMYIAKVTNTLGIVYETTINGFSGSSLDDFARGIQVDGSSNVYVTGITTHSTQGKNITTVKLNSSGVVQWTKNINGSYNGNDGATDLAIDASANVYVTGFQTIGTGNTDIYSAKLDNSTGNIIWEKLEAYPLNDEGTNLILDNNDVIVAGSREKTTGTFEYVTYKYIQRDIITPTEVNGQVNDKTFLFNENIGQEMDETSAPVSSKKFVTNSSPKYYFTGNNMSMVFASSYADSNKVDTIHRIDINFEGSTSDNKIYGYEEFGINPTYILGQLSKPRTAPKGNQRMVISELYSGIDLQYYSNKDGGLKYYFIVKPGADPRLIKQFFNSTSYTTAINGSNQLVVTSSVGKITLSQPLSYQLNSAGTPIVLAGSSYWHSYATNKYDFTLPSYTSSLTLIIMINQASPQQPLSTVNLGNLKWSTFIGGGHDDSNWDVTIDKFGNQHIAGGSNSLNLPTAGYQLIHSSSVSTSNRYATYFKFNSLNQMLICTYFGGDQQSEAMNVSTNSQGDAYITGITQAIDIPYLKESGAYNDTVAGNTFGGADEDGYILKFNAANQYVWGTYFGGTNNDGIFASTIDKNDNLYVTGRTSNSSMPLVPNGSAYQQSFSGGLRDIFIAKFNSNDNLTWFTYYGGTNQDEPYSCKTDSNNNLFITGTTISSNFPHFRASSSFYKDSTLNGTLNDLFILKFNSSGVRQWSTLYGGSNYEASNSWVSHKGIAFDNAQNVYIVDNTASSDLFTKRLNSTCYYDSTYGGNTDGFLLKFSQGLVLQYASYIGDSSYDFVHTGQFDSNDNLYLSYETASGSTQTTSFGNYYYQNTMLGNPLSTTYGLDNFLLSLNSSMVRRWATFLGGTSHNATGDGGTSISIKGSDMYLTGFCNSFYVNSSDIRFPISYNGVAYIDSTYNDNAQTNTSDGFIGKFDLSAIIGIEELFKDNTNDLVLFPNPTNNSLNIKFTSLKQEKIKLSIFTLDGKLVFESPYPTMEGINIIKINTNNLTTSMYILKIQGENYSATEKFVKYE